MEKLKKKKKEEKMIETWTQYILIPILKVYYSREKKYKL